MKWEKSRGHPVSVFETFLLTAFVFSASCVLSLACWSGYLCNVFWHVLLYELGTLRLVGGRKSAKSGMSFFPFV